MTWVQRISWTIHELVSEGKRQEIRQTTAYKAGVIARQSNDDWNPHVRGSKSYWLWQKGYRDEENHEMTVW